MWSRHVIAMLLALAAAPSSSRILFGKYISVSISGKACDVTASPYNAVGDGKTMDTDAIQKALDDKSCGQIVFAAPRTFLVTALKITRNNCELVIQEGAVLLVSNDFKHFPNNAHVISARGVNNIAISGSGTVDGQGLAWWREMKKPGMDKMWRPHLVDFSHVDTALLTDTLVCVCLLIELLNRAVAILAARNVFHLFCSLTLFDIEKQFLNGPNHVLELYCNNCELSGVRVLSPPSTGDCEKTDSCRWPANKLSVRFSFVHLTFLQACVDGVVCYLNIILSTPCSHNTDAVDVHGSPFYIHGVNFTTGEPCLCPSVLYIYIAAKC